MLKHWKKEHCCLFERFVNEQKPAEQLLKHQIPEMFLYVQQQCFYMILL